MRVPTMRSLTETMQRLWEMSPLAPRGRDAGPPPSAPSRGRKWSIKRGFSRHKVMVPTVARSRDRSVSGLSASVSMGGLFLVCAQALPRDTEVTVEMAPPGKTAAPIRAHGAVAYHRGQGMGIRFTGVSQSDFQRLQGLVRGFFRA